MSRFCKGNSPRFLWTIFFTVIKNKLTLTPFYNSHIQKSNHTDIKSEWHIPKILDIWERRGINFLLELTKGDCWDPHYQNLHHEKPNGGNKSNWALLIASLKRRAWRPKQRRKLGEGSWQIKKNPNYILLMLGNTNGQKEATEYYEHVFLLFLNMEGCKDSTINHIKLIVLSMLLWALRPGTASVPWNCRDGESLSLGKASCCPLISKELLVSLCTN